MPEDSLKELEAIYLEGKSQTAYIPYARALRQSKAYSKAHEVCLKGLESDPDSLTGRLLLVEIYMDMGRYDSALRAITECSQLAPHSYRVNLTLLRLLLKRRDFEQALKVLKSLRQEYPFDEELINISSKISEELQANATAEVTPAERHKTHIAGFRERLDSLMNQLKKEKSVRELLLTDIGKVEMAESKTCAQNPRLKLLRDTAIKLGEILSRFDLGALKQGLIEMENGYVLFYVFQSRLLCIAMDTKTNIGRMRFKVESFLYDRQKNDSHA